jgi:plasmid maintenance system antidote protein VapI
MEKVKKLIEAGMSIPAAIKEALAQNGLDVSGFAERYQLNRAAASNHINGNVRPTDATIDALVSELGGAADEWRELLWLAAKPEKASA